MTDVAAWIDSYVDVLVAAGHIRSERVERAFRCVPRHRCIPGYHLDGGRYVEVPQADRAQIPSEVLSYIYADSVPIATLDGGRRVCTSMRPAQMADMLEALDLHGGERVLEIGTGTGYNAALLAELTGVEVVTVDHDPDVVDAARASLRRLGEERVTVVAGDGYHGHPDAPYDRVVVAVGAPGVAEPWLDQLDLDRFVVAPVSAAGSYAVVSVERGRPWTATGRGVCWSDLGMGQGALAHLHDPADNRPLVLQAPRVVRRFEPSLGDGAYDGLSAFVMFSDRRARRHTIEGPDPAAGLCVIRGRSGAVAVFRRDAIIVDGPDRLADQVLQLTDSWVALGNPPFTDWDCKLTLRRLPTGRFWQPYRWNAAGSTFVPDAREPR